MVTSPKLAMSQSDPTKDQSIYERRYRGILPFLVLLSVSLCCIFGITLFPLATSKSFSKSQTLPVSLHSAENADYSADPFPLVIPPVGLGILADIIRDEYPNRAEALSRIQKIFQVLAEPIQSSGAAVLAASGEDENDTPPSGDEPAPPADDTEKGETSPTPEVAAASPTEVINPTEVPSPTPISYVLPTATQPKPTAKPTEAKVPAPTATPLPSATATPTGTGTSTSTATATGTATATNTPLNSPTNTNTPVDTATNTPVNTATPTPTDTNTPVSSSCSAPVQDDGELPEGFVQSIAPADDATGVALSQSTILITFNQAMTYGSTGGSVEKTNLYKITQEGNASKAIDITASTYNSGSQSVTISFDTSDADWIADTWYEITIKPGIHNECGTGQGINVITRFKTAP